MTSGAAAVVLGAGVNLAEVVRALRLAEVPVDLAASCALSARLVRCEDDLSRGRSAALDDVVARLVRHGRSRAVPPTLLPVTDEALLLASRYRDELSVGLRVAVADAGLVEALVDKAAFGELARRYGWPVPRTLEALAGAPLTDAPPYPLLVKPLRRTAAWHAGVGAPKAVVVERADQLDELWRQLDGVGERVLLQELVPGPESRVESYHAYTDASGEIVAEFTGRKVRTLPAAFGHTTALEVTRCEDVLSAGRAVLADLGLTGLVKVDLKRAPDGSLRLLEVNPRGHLWHHPGAVAGINLPALAHADLAGLPRPATTWRPGVRWVRLRDRRVARVDGLGSGAWALEALASRAKAFWWGDSPAPLLGVTAARLAARVPGRRPAQEPEGVGVVGPSPEPGSPTARGVA